MSDFNIEYEIEYSDPQLGEYRSELVSAETARDAMVEVKKSCSLKQTTHLISIGLYGMRPHSISDAVHREVSKLARR